MAGQRPARAAGSNFTKTEAIKKSSIIVICSVVVLLAIAGAIFWHGSTRSQIIGTWRVGPAKVVFKPDGSFTTGFGTNQFGGTWTMSGKMMTLTLTNMTGGKASDKIGDTKQIKIVRVDSRQLSIDEDGHTQVLRRSK